MQRLRAVGATFIRLEWADKTHDTIALPKGERTWQGEHLVTQSEATGRFSDACALMISAKPLAGNLNPSLQMGDAAHPVQHLLLGCNPWARHPGSYRPRNHQADRAGVSGAGTICSRKAGRDHATAGPAAGDAGSGGDLERQPTGPRRSKVLLHMATTADRKSTRL